MQGLTILYLLGVVIVKIVECVWGGGTPSKFKCVNAVRSLILYYYMER